jgi:hypothetical protein
MSKKFILLFITGLMTFSIACRQQNPTPVQSTYQPRDTNRPIASHGQANQETHGNSTNHEAANIDTMNANTMNANTSMMNANMNNQPEMKRESRTNTGN